MQLYNWDICKFTVTIFFGRDLAQICFKRKTWIIGSWWIFWVLFISALKDIKSIRISGLTVCNMWMKYVMRSGFFSSFMCAVNVDVPLKLTECLSRDATLMAWFTSGVECTLRYIPFVILQVKSATVIYYKWGEVFLLFLSHHHNHLKPCQLSACCWLLFYWLLQGLQHN